MHGRHGRRMDARWSAIGRPVKHAYCCEHCVSIWATLLSSLYHHCASFGRPIASTVRWQWRPLCLHSATTATLEPPWQLSCVHSASFVRPAHVVPLQQIWSFKEDTGVVLQQLHRNRTFWFGRPLSVLTIFWSLKGGTMVASLCKGGFNAYHIYWKNRGFFLYQKIIFWYQKFRNFWYQKLIFDIRKAFLISEKQH